MAKMKMMKKRMNSGKVAMPGMMSPYGKVNGYAVKKSPMMDTIQPGTMMMPKKGMMSYGK